MVAVFEQGLMFHGPWSLVALSEVAQQPSSPLLNKSHKLSKKELTGQAQTSAAQRIRELRFSIKHRHGTVLSFKRGLETEKKNAEAQSFACRVANSSIISSLPPPMA